MIKGVFYYEGLSGSDVITKHAVGVVLGNDVPLEDYSLCGIPVNVYDRQFGLHGGPMCEVCANRAWTQVLRRGKANPT